MLTFIRRHKVLSLFIFLLIGFAIFTAVRWRVWFHNPSEDAYVAGSEPRWVLLTFGNDGELSRTVSWMCGDEVRESSLELIDIEKADTTVVSATGEVFESRSGKAAYYHARLNDLRHDATYAYRVITDHHKSPWYSFQTYGEHRSRFSFLFVGDVQDTIGGRSNVMLKEAIRRNPQSEFIVCGGDLTERPAYQYWEETFRDIDSIAQHMPLLSVTGNHDYLKGVINSLERRYPLIFSYFLESKIDDNMVYTLTYGDAQFFLLDSNREFFYLFSQQSWLEEQLEASTAKWKIVVVHHPLYSIKGNNLIQKWIFNDLIKEHDVDLVLQGHEHAYARRTMKDDSGKPTTPVYTISHCSPKNYLIDFDDEFDKFGISSRYYQLVNIKDDTMSLATYDANTSQLYDSLDIIKHYDNLSIIDQGKHINENMNYTVNPSSSKSLRFKQRIDDYKRRHPERVGE